MGMGVCVRVGGYIVVLLTSFVFRVLLLYVHACTFIGEDLLVLPHIVTNLRDYGILIIFIA